MLGFLVRRRFLTATCILVAALGAGALLVKPGLRKDYTLGAFIASRDADYFTLRRTMDEFVSNELALIAVRTDDALSPASIALTAELVHAIEPMPFVERVAALTQIPRPVRWLLGDRLPHHPLIERNLISADGRTAAIVIQMAGERQTGRQRRAVVAALRRLVEQARRAHPGARIIIAGPYVTLIDMYAYVDRDLVRFSAAAFVLVAVMLWLVFRRVGPSLFGLGAGLAAMICALGVGVILDFSMSLIVQMLVILVVVLTVANCVHLAVAFEDSERLLTPGTDRLAAARRTLGRMWLPCTAVAITTMAGFGSVCISNLTPVRGFGTLMVVGLVFGWGFGLGLVPLLASGRRAGGGALRRRRLTRGLIRVAVFSLRRRWGVVGLFLVVTVGMALGFGRLRFESDFVKNFRAGSEVRRSYEFIEHHLTPLGSIEIIIRRMDGDNIVTPEAVRRLDALGEEIVGRHGDIIKKAMTLADLVRLGDEPVPELRFPLRMRLALANVLLGDEAVRNFVNDGRTALRLNLRAVEGVSVSEKLDLARAIASESRAMMGPDYEVTVTGLYYFYAKLVDALLRDQYESFAIALVAVFVVFALWFSSIRIALLAMVPNVVPVALCLGTMGWIGIPVNMTTVMMLSVVFGIAVDDTIHYLWRCRETCAQTGDYRRAILRTHRGVGRACLFTSIVIAGGFWILVLSQFLPTAYFGGLVGYTMLGALASDLILLPVLIDWLRPFSGRAKHGHDVGVGTSEVPEKPQPQGLRRQQSP